VFAPSDCAYGGTYPNCNPAPTQQPFGTNCPTGQVYDSSVGFCVAQGQTVADFCTSQGETYNSTTGLCNTPTGTSSSTSSSGLTPAQINAIIAGTTKVGTVAAAGATGATVLPNGTVIGSGGSNAATLATLGATFKSMLPILVIGVVAVFALKGTGK
jgi:hypothetical protein